MNTQQTELVGTAILEAALVREGFNVARPAIDFGIDLIVFSAHRNKKFKAIPIQIKVSTEAKFYLHKKYRKFKDLVLAYIWHIHKNPRIFLMTYDEALDVLGPQAVKSNSWAKGGHYFFPRISASRLKEIEKYENRWDWLRTRLEEED